MLCIVLTDHVGCVLNLLKYSSIALINLRRVWRYQRVFVRYSFFIWSLRCLSFSLNFGFWLPLWYLQTLLRLIKAIDEYLSRFNTHPTWSVNTMHTNPSVLLSANNHWNCLSFAGACESPPVFGGVHVSHQFSSLCSIFCFVYLRLVSCVLNVASTSGFSNLDCPFGFL
jgi:hypothetical protein